MTTPRAIASFDSASVMLEATARGIRGQVFDVLGHGRLFGAAVRTANRLPLPVRRQLYSIAGGAEGIPPRRLGDVDIEAVDAWITGHYERRRYPAVLVGASNGAAVHLATALGVPWLPQTVLIPVRWWGNSPLRPDRALEFGARVAPPLLARNPGIRLHHMHDANQDWLMVRRMAYFRIKRQRLGAAYRRFLRDSLEPEAPIIVLADDSTWPVTTVAERHVFQVGAQGGLTPEQYDRRGLRPDTTAPEAEWGFDRELLTDLRQLAAETGHPLHLLEYADPHALSAPVADLHRAWRPHARRVLVESFFLIDPIRTLRAGLVPLWTFFSVESAVDLAREYLSTRHFAAAYVGMFPHGVRSRGIAEPDRWLAALHGLVPRVELTGVDPGRYPADFAALVRYGPALEAITPQPPAPDVPGSLPVETVLDALLPQPKE